MWFVIDAASVAWGDDMAAFLCFMGVRLIEMRRVLRDDGSLYLHCDPTASHYLKALLDAVFGRRQFRNEIVWKRFRFHADAKRFGRVSDSILFYTRSDSYLFNRQFGSYSREYIESKFKRDDNGRLYTLSDLNPPAGRGPVYKYHGIERAWRFTEERMKRLESEGRIYLAGKTPRIKRFLDEMPGQAVTNTWTDIDPVNSQAKERTGWPTQKPLALYERIIAASSNSGDIVCDPFAGCATTPIAAERLGRQWVAMDIWDGAFDIVRQRMEDNRQLLTDADPQIHYVTEPPERTDDGVEAVPFLQVTERIPEPDDVYYSNAAKREHLLRQHGPRCQGCDRTFDDPRYLELDHNTPRSDGGLNHITNRILLCGPCNRLKSNTYTLSGLRRENRRHGYMAAGS